MITTKLLSALDLAGDSAESILKLRGLILDLAIRGRLTVREDCDGRAADLVAAIDAKLGRHAGGVRFEYFGATALPEIPDNWSWAHIGHLCSKTGSGSTPRGGQTAYRNTGIPFLRSQNVYDDGLRLADVVFIDEETHTRMASTGVKPFDLLLNITGGSIGRCCLISEDFGAANISQHVAVIRPALTSMAPFLHCVVRSPFFQGFIEREQTGAGRGGLPKNRMDLIPVPLPSLSEQHRIVAKVDELMALCDQLEAARREREAARDRLTTSTLARLNASDPDSIVTDARFALNVLPALTARPDQLKQLRQTILSLAVCGGLSPHGSWWDSPKALGEVASLQNGYAFKSESFTTVGMRLLRNLNVSHGYVVWKDQVCLPSCQSEEFSRFLLNEGDVVLSLDRPFISTGTKVAKIRRQDVPSLLLQRVGRFRPSDQVLPDYLYLWATSPHFSSQVDPGRSSGVPHISAKQVEAAKIFVPPIAEQRLIVSRVESLMALFTQLEKRQESGLLLRDRLLDVLVNTAL